MPVQELTEEFMECLKNNIPESGSVSYFDTKIKGFMLEYRSSGTGTFYLRYRNWNKKIQFMLIGRMNKLSVMEARFKAHELKKMIKEGGDPKKELQRLRDIPTFAVFVTERYLPYAKIRKRSWATDEQILRNHLLPRFGEQRLHHISRSDVIKMQFTTRSQGYAPGTCNRVLILMKFILNCALRWQVLPSGENPCVGVSLLEDNGARERYLTREEAQRLLQELDNNRNTQVAWIIKLLLFTGARKREILDAKWEHIDFERRILTVPLSKSGKARHIPLSDTAVDILKKIPREKHIPWVFYNKRTGKPPVSIFTAWNNIRERVGIPDVRLHDLRHSFASFLVNSGCSLYEVQKILGHYDPKVTMRYAHLSSQSLIEAANKVGNAVAGKVPRKTKSSL